MKDTAMENLTAKNLKANTYFEFEGVLINWNYWTGFYYVNKIIKFKRFADAKAYFRKQIRGQL
jgi:hypothetical protein